MTGKLKNLIQRSSRLKGGSKSYTLYPRRDWSIAFFIFVFLNLVSVALLVFLYPKVDQYEDSLDLAGEKSVLFDRGLFDERLNQYQEKARRLDLLSSESPKTIDPSI